MPEQVGLQGVFDVSQYNAGIDDYLGGMDAVGGASDQAAASMESVGDATDFAGESLGAVGDAAAESASGFEESGEAAEGAAGGFEDMGEGAQDAAGDLGDLGEQSKETAGRFGDLEKMLGQVGIAMSFLGLAKLTADLTELGAEVMRSDGAFGAMVGGAEEAESAMDALGIATEGEVTRLDIQRWATEALTMGLADNADQLTRTAAAAAGLADIVGKDTNAALQQFNFTLASGSPRAMRAMGLSVADVEREIEKITAAYPWWNEQMVRNEAILRVAEATITRVGNAIPPAADNIDKFNTTLADLKASAGEGAASIFLPLIGGINDVVHSLRPFTDAWTDAWVSLPAGEKWLTATGLGAVVPVFHALTLTIRDLVGEDLGGWLDETGASLTDFLGITQDTATGVGGLGEWLDTAGRKLTDFAGITQENVAIEALNPPLDSMGRYLQTVAREAGPAAAALRDMGQAASIAGPSMFELGQAVDGTLQGISDLATLDASGLYNLAKATGATDEQLNELAIDLGLANSAQLQAMATAQSLATQLSTGAITADQYRVSMGLLAESLNQEAAASDPAAQGAAQVAEATALADQQARAAAQGMEYYSQTILNIPSAKSTTITTPGLNDAYNKIQAYKTMLDNMPAVVSTLYELHTQGLPAGGSIPGFAEGGTVYADQPSFVGEQGIELLVPRSDGEIIPNDVLASLARGGRGGGDSYVEVTIGPVNITSEIDMREFETRVQRTTEHALESWG